MFDLTHTSFTVKYYVGSKTIQIQDNTCTFTVKILLKSCFKVKLQNGYWRKKKY